ncbi:MAG: hypothetical protein FD180_4210 [Planctomycetota bacterium]|nr:MAG: hypothetical protein FD180_4210 [Planctomycetota bacterium]
MLTRMRKTVADYMAYDEERVELIDGEFLVTASPTPRHQEVIGNLYVLLRYQLKKFRATKVYLSPFDTILSRFDVVQPDLVLLSNGSLKRLRPKLEGPPDVAIEVLSKLSKKHDLVTKRNLYHEFRFPEYWIVDPDKETVTVLLWRPDDWLEHGVFKRGELVTSEVMKGVVAPVSEIFE